MLISVTLLSALCVAIGALRMTATPASLTPGSKREVTLHCYWGYAAADAKSVDEGRLASLVISKLLPGGNIYADVGGISLADEDAVILNETIRSSVTYRSGRLTQVGPGQSSTLTITVDTTNYGYDVVGQYRCQGNFLNLFGDFHTLNAYVQVKGTSLTLTPSPSTVTSDRSDPLTLNCDVTQTGDAYGTLTSLVIIKMNEDVSAEHHDLAGVTMLHREKVKVAETSRSFVTGQGRLNGVDDSYLTIQVDPTSAHIQLPGIYKCKAMFISKLGHVTTTTSEATVTLETPGSLLQSAFAVVDPEQVGR